MRRLPQTDESKHAARLVVLAPRSFKRGPSYVACFNARYQRTGTLWEGRFKAASVDSERYVLACHRYIELNPVGAGMVRQVSDYRWSSYHANAPARPRRASGRIQRICPSERILTSGAPPLAISSTRACVRAMQKRRPFTPTSRNRGAASASRANSKCQTRSAQAARHRSETTRLASPIS